MEWMIPLFLFLSVLSQHLLEYIGFHEIYAFSSSEIEILFSPSLTQNILLLLKFSAKTWKFSGFPALTGLESKLFHVNVTNFAYPKTQTMTIGQKEL